MTRTDVVVIGGGIVGLVSAIRLAESGAGVTIVDAGQNAGSTANAGSLHVQMQSRFMRLYPDQVANIEAALPFYRAAVAEWVALDKTHGPFEMVRKGGLMLAEGSDQMRFLAAKAKREETKGLSVEMLDRGALEVIAPWLGPQITGAELCHDEGKLNPLLANSRLRDRANSLGVTFIKDRVGSLEQQSNGVTAQGEKMRYDADLVVVSAAWGAGDIVKNLGVSIPSRPEPLHMNITEAASARINHLIQHAERSITMKQLASGQIVIGGGWPARDHGREKVPGVVADSVLGNVALAARLVPSIAGLRVIRTWAGMNTTVDGASVIGPLPGASRVIMAVPGDAGYTLGPLVARCVVDGILGQPNEAALGFDPDRFLN